MQRVLKVGWPKLAQYGCRSLAKFRGERQVDSMDRFDALRIACKRERHRADECCS
ncbi:hypothetical protein BOSE21B_30520 [Bosea sp. 21B]|nr:hypothetical protein BOSE21B_30520 [Bosea sp. 21B]